MGSRTYVPVLLVLAAAWSAMTGCSARTVDQAGFTAASRVAVVSVVMPRVADMSRDGNRAVLQASVNRACEQAQKGLAAAHSWSVVDPVKERKGKAVLAFGKVSDGDMADLFPDAEERKRVRGLVLSELAAWKEQFVGAEGLPPVPRPAFARTDQDPQTDPSVRMVMLRQAGRLCGELQVDAVAFVHVRARIAHPRAEAFIVADNRTDGMLSMAQTMVIVDKTGRIIADMGWPPLDSDARARDLLPLYRGAGRDSVKDENIDLADPKKKVPLAFTALIDETAGDLLAALRKAAGK